MKRLFAAFLCLLFVFTALVGCGDNSSNNQTTETVATTTAKATDKPVETTLDTSKPVNLTLTLWGNDNYVKLGEELAAINKEKHPNVSAEIVLIPFTEYAQKLSIMIAADMPPDVAWLASEMATQHIENGSLLDVSAIEDDKDFDIGDIYPSTLEPLRRGEKLYGVTTNAAPGVIFFNKTLFAEKGIQNPLELVKENKWTYAQMRESALALTDASKGLYGVRLAREWTNWPDTLVDLIWAYGGDILSADYKKFALNTPEGEAALQYFSDLMFVDKVHPKPGEQTSFDSGKIAMYRDKFSYTGKLATVAFDWDIAPLPKGPSANAPVWVGASAYSVFAKTKYPQESMELVKAFTGKAGQTIAIRLIPPSRKSIQESDAFLKAKDKPSEEGLRASIINTLSSSSKIFLTPQNWPLIQAAFQSSLDELYGEKSDPKTVLGKMQKEIDALEN